MPNVKLAGTELLEYFMVRGMTRKEAIASMREHNQDMLKYFMVRGTTRKEAIASMREHNQDMAEIESTDTK